MIVVVCACNDAQPRIIATSDRTRCGRCGVELQVLLDVEQNKERVARGIDLAAWFAAPRTPATRAGCETEPRPCPHLRCRHHLGVPGRYGCALDVAEDAATSSEPLVHHTLEHVGNHLGLGRARVHQIEVETLVQLRVRSRRRP